MPCLTPYYKKEKHLMSWLPLSCGKCGPCRLKRTQQWVFRMEQELKVSYSAYFVTLTYGEDDLPYSGEGFPTLFHKDIQNFLKRLREHNQEMINEEVRLDKLPQRVVDEYWDRRYKLKYYMCGEYGEKNSRPHYHLVIFNLRGVRKFTESLFKSKAISECWIKGRVHIGSFTSNSAAYCVKYIDKAGKVPEFTGDDRKKEYSVMSKGIGKYYVNDAAKQFHKNRPDNNYVSGGKGFKVAMPRYYRDKIYTEEEKDAQKDLLRISAKEVERRLYKDWKRFYPNSSIDFENWKKTRIIGNIASDHKRKKDARS